ncbi:hypothetical protein [Crenothrix polyspora]|uniref:Uncharacterized protein n=1 Tax=Crenothrix polyspora TaxID=360316 RepID=A0A1R4H1M8_9GAMM|nr:hypothetical protein [Crenothrix polyspora]SJM90144.1 hypothetical protein CRENPOLYSF1_1360003 [Crenothrix polyspora]
MSVSVQDDIYPSTLFHLQQHYQLVSIATKSVLQKLGHSGFYQKYASANPFTWQFAYPLGFFKVFLLTPHLPNQHVFYSHGG